MLPVGYAKSLHQILARAEAIAEREKNLAEICMNTLQHVSGEKSEYETTGEMYLDFNETQDEFKFGPNMFGKVKELNNSGVDWCNNVSVYSESVLNLTLAVREKHSPILSEEDRNDALSAVCKSMFSESSDDDQQDMKVFDTPKMRQSFLNVPSDAKFNPTKNQKSLPDVKNTSTDENSKQQGRCKGCTVASSPESNSEDWSKKKSSPTKSTTNIDNGNNALISDTCLDSSTDGSLDEFFHSPLFGEQEISDQDKNGELFHNPPKMNRLLLNDKVMSKSAICLHEKSSGTENDSCSYVEPRQICRKKQNKQKSSISTTSSESSLNIDSTIVNGRRLRKRTPKSAVSPRYKRKGCTPVQSSTISPRYELNYPNGISPEVTDSHVKLCNNVKSSEPATRYKRKGCTPVQSSTRNQRYDLRYTNGISSEGTDSQVKSSSKPEIRRSRSKNKRCYTTPSSERQIRHISSNGRGEAKKCPKSATVRERSPVAAGTVRECSPNSPRSSLCIIMLERVELGNRGRHTLLEKKVV